MSLRLTRKSILSVVVIAVSTVLFGAAGNPPVVGRLISSAGATLAGEAVPAGGTIRLGDVLTTRKAGNALVVLAAETEASLSENTSVRFSRGGTYLSMRLSSGAVRAKSLGKDSLIVETPEYRIEPVEHGKAVYWVAMLPDRTTVVAARHGKVSITQVTSGQNYVVDPGHFAKLSNSPSGVPASGPATGGLHALLQSPAAMGIIAVGAGTGTAFGVAEGPLAEPGPASPSSR